MNRNHRLPVQSLTQVRKGRNAVEDCGKLS